MEEKEKNNGKEIKMDVVKNEKKEPRRLDYDELNNLCAELSEQNQQMRGYIKNLRGQIEQLVNNNILQRLGFLFDVLKYKDQFNPDFVIYCVDEIKAALVIPEETEPKDQEKKG